MCCVRVVIFIICYCYSCVYICGWLFHLFSLMFLCCPCNWSSGCCVRRLVQRIQLLLLLLLFLLLVVVGCGGGGLAATPPY